MMHAEPVTQAFNAPPHQCLHHLLQDQARRTPDAPAIAAPGRIPLTYGRLQAHVDEVVQTLHAMGLGRHDRIALALPSGPEMAVAFLAVAASSTCAPLNPAYSAEEFDRYLTALHATALIVQGPMHAFLRRVAHARGLCIIELWSVIEAEAGLFRLTRANPPSEKSLCTTGHGFARPEDVALVLHTSGTTSQPKIVLLTHSNICTSAHNTRVALALTESDRSLCVPPLFHVHGLISAMLSSLVAGASVMCPPDFAAHEFFVWMSQYRPTWYTGVPAIHQAILACATLYHDIIAGCPLRFIRSSSASLPTHLLQEVERVFNAPLIEFYGMTETLLTTSNPLPPRPRKIGSVGIATGADVAIMDQGGILLPEGAIGEIVVRGPTVFQGYETDAAANRSAFTSGWFRTGDQGYFDADGYLFLTGRLKEMINRGGEKVAPREVDDVLMDHPAVAQAVTFAVPHPHLGEEIAAAIVLHQNAATTARDVRQFAARRLAAFKVPRQVLILEDIPKSPIGKVQRLGLAEKLGLTVPQQTPSQSNADDSAPRTPVEEILTGLWARFLHAEHVSRHDDFFLVGDSLIATQLISRIRDTLQVDISFPSFFETPTVADMAKSIEAASRAGSGCQAPPIHPRPRDRAIPLSSAQERLWFLEQLEPGCTAYNISAAVRLVGRLHVSPVERSLGEIIRRHDILRTTFIVEDGRPLQAIASAGPWTLPVLDLQEVATPESQVQVLALARAEAGRPFDLAQGPLLRATLLRLGAEEHVLLLTLHHIISDGWSQGVFWRELGVLYEAFATEKPSPLPELGIQYADFAVWQRQWLQGDVLARQLAYWKQQLAGLSMLQLPTYRPRPALQTFRGARHPVVFSPTQWQALKGLSQSYGVTLFMTLLAAFQALLHRYTGQDDIAVGSFIANRNWIETEGLIGFFVNTLILRTDLSGNPSFREIIERVRQVTLGAYSHQDLPYEKLVEELRPPRDVSRNPLFQVLFTLRNTPRQTPELAGLTLKFLEVPTETAKFDVTLELAETSEGLGGWFEYNTDVFDTVTIARMAGHLQTLLTGILVDPEQRLAMLPLLTTDEQRQLLTDWNDTAADYPLDTSIHALFEAQVAQTPDAVAVVGAGEVLTYHALNRCANQVAHHLQRLGVQPEVRVGLCTERSLAMVVGLLGILKAGGAYVPLDPTYPLERLAFMLQDAQISVLLTQEALVARLPDEGAVVVCLDSGWQEIARHSDENPSSGVSAEHLASVLYTSGSTGRAKGVLGTHRATVHVLAWLWQAFPFAPQEVACQKTSMSFVDAIQELLAPLLRGIQTVLMPHEILQQPPELVQRLAAHRVTRILLVPSLLQVLLNTHSDLQHRLPSLTLWFASGEVLSRQLWQDFQERLPDSRLINLYGASENTADATWFDTALLRREHGSVPIGRPIANTQIYGLNRQLQPVPVGVPGELHVGGLGLARGYLNRPELTAEKFIPNPFSNEPGSRLYKTGDLARYLPDGNLEYLGRLDQQVKIRGVRIELGEIEVVLEQHTAIRQAVLLTREYASGDTRLVAYIVANQQLPPTSTALRSFLQAKLPEYMVPAAFVVLTALPLTPSGKVDRRALPPHDWSRSQLENVFVAPQDALEHQLIQIWQDVLGVQPIGVQDDFFELGGHSLLAVQLFAQIEKRTGKRLPLATLFQRPTIAHLASLLRHVEVIASDALAVEIYQKTSSAERIRHPLATYVPVQYHAYLRDQYSRLQQAPAYLYVRGQYVKFGKKLMRRFFSYTPVQLETQLRDMGLEHGDTVLMHSAFNVLNGFEGTPDQVIDSVLHIIGNSGNLLMVSMPYTRFTYEYIQAAIPFDVRYSMSAMGVVTEIFRHKTGVVRSLNPAHSVLACGPDAQWLIADHEKTMFSCGKGSPFEKILQLSAKALFFDVSLRRMTFFHYLEDLFQETLPQKLYDDAPVESIVITKDGKEHIVKTYVFSSEARKYRSMRSLEATLRKNNIAKMAKIGNTKLTLLDLPQVVACTQNMLRAGQSLWKI